MSQETFGFDQSTTESNGSDFKYLVVTKDNAIQGDIFFKDFVVGEWADGAPFLEVTVANKAGQTTTGRYSLYSKGTPEETEKSKKGLQAVCKNFATKVLGDNITLTGTSLKDFFEKMVQAIKAKPGWDKLNLTAVFIHDASGYTKLRKFSPVVELTSNVAEVAKLKLTDKEISAFVDKKQPSNEGTTTFGVNSAPIMKAGTTGSDLPF